MIKICPHCNQPFKPPVDIGNRQKYCSKACSVQARITRITKTCETCGKSFEVVKSRVSARHCSKACQTTRVELACIVCGTTFYEKRSHAHYRETCSRSCQAKLRARTGKHSMQGRTRTEAEKQLLRERTRHYFQKHPEKHNWYVDGAYAHGQLRRGPSWQTQRARARARDTYICRICGISESQLGKQLSVHHIKRYRLFASSDEANALDNLICVCQSCHWKLEHGSIPFPIYQE